MSRLIAISTILVFTAAGPVFAQDDEMARNGIYLGVSVPVVFLTEGRDDISPGVGVRGGYRFHPHFAGEVQFEWFPSMDIKYSGVSSVELDMLTFTGNVKGYLLTGRAQPFLLLGAGLMRFELDDRVGLGIHEKGDGFAARFGGDVVTQGTSFSLSIRATCFQPAMQTIWTTSWSSLVSSIAFSGADADNMICRL